MAGDGADRVGPACTGGTASALSARTNSAQVANLRAGSLLIARAIAAETPCGTCGSACSRLGTGSVRWPLIARATVPG